MHVILGLWMLDSADLKALSVLRKVLYILGQPSTLDTIYAAYQEPKVVGNDPFVGFLTPKLPDD